MSTIIEWRLITIAYETVYTRY